MRSDSALVTRALGPDVGTAHATFALLAGYALLITGNGLLCMLISLRLVQQQASPSLTGVVQSAYYVGFLLGATFSSPLIARMGHRRAFVAFASMSAFCVPIYAIWSEPWLWLVLRALMGFSLMVIFTAMESWLHQAVGNAQRCRMFSAYMITNYLGLGAGQLLASLAEPASFQLFGCATALFASSVIPVCLTRQAHQCPRAGNACATPPYRWQLMHELSGVLAIYRRAPLAVVACFAAGLFNSAFCSMQPAFMRLLNYPLAQVSYFMGFALLAALVSQWPAARLADRIDRRKVLLLLAVLSEAFSMLVASLKPGLLMEACGYMYVGAAFSMYGIITSYANDQTPDDERIAVSAGLLLIFSLGACIGPTLASAAMRVVGPAGLYLFSATTAGGLAVLTLCSLARGK
jgi:MFS family permease